MKIGIVTFITDKKALSSTQNILELLNNQMDEVVYIAPHELPDNSSLDALIVPDTSGFDTNGAAFSYSQYSTAHPPQVNEVRRFFSYQFPIWAKSEIPLIMCVGNSSAELYQQYGGKLLVRQGELSFLIRKDKRDSDLFEYYPQEGEFAVYEPHILHIEQGSVHRIGIADISPIHEPGVNFFDLLRTPVMKPKDDGGLEVVYVV